nr:hypothetical protein [Micromonospora sp. HM5-17]
MGEHGTFGGATEPGSAREEAERLVATVFAMAQSAASGARAGAFGPVGNLISDVLDHVGRPSGRDASVGRSVSGDTPGPAASGGPGAGAAGPDGGGSAGGGSTSHGGTPTGAGFATGTAECCICPVCRTIAALRDPSPDLVERLATGAGDFAAGVASLLRAFSGVAGAARDAAPADLTPTGSAADPTSGRSAADPTSGRSAADRDPGRFAGEGSAGSAARFAEAADRAAGTRSDSGPTDQGLADGLPSEAGESQADLVWREATRTGHDSWPAAETDVWAAATRAEPGAAVSDDPADPDRPTSDGPTSDERSCRTGSGDFRAGAGERRAAVPASRTPEGTVAGPADQVASGGA